MTSRTYPIKFYKFSGGVEIRLLNMYFGLLKYMSTVIALLVQMKPIQESIACYGRGDTHLICGFLCEVDGTSLTFQHVLGVQHHFLYQSFQTRLLLEHPAGKVQQQLTTESNTLFPLANDRFNVLYILQYDDLNLKLKKDCCDSLSMLLTCSIVRNETYYLAFAITVVLVRVKESKIN